MQVLFVQGVGEGTYDDWDIKLVESLKRALGSEHEVRYPRMPNESDASYLAWKAALEIEFSKLEDGAMAVGHSAGGTILINAIAENPPGFDVGGIFLVAVPFMGEGGWPSEDVQSGPDLGARLPAGVPVYLYHGSDDDTAPFAHVELYARAIPQAVVRRLVGRDHQLNEDLSEVAADILALS